MMTFNFLHLLAWGFGLFVVYGLRDEFQQRAKTWSLLVWGVWSCLVMETARLLTPLSSGLALVSSAAGVSSGILFFMAFRSLQSDLCWGKSALFPETFSRQDWDRRLGQALLAASILCVSAGWAFHDAVASSALILISFSGAVWLLVSAWLVAGFMSARCSSDQARIYTPHLLAASFVFAFLGPALSLLVGLMGFAMPQPLRALLNTLFILTLVIVLHGMVLRIRNQKLAGTLQELKRMQQKQFEVEKMRVVGTIAAGAVHDFQNVLTTILMRSKLALEEPGLSDHTRRDFEKISQAVASAAAVTEGFLGLARGKSEQGPYASLRQVVEETLDLLIKDLEQHKIRVVRKIEEVPGNSLDLGLLAQVCLNLYINARDAMKPLGSGILNVTLTSEDDRAEIVVSDTGTGIPEGFREKIFQPFESTKGDSGTGLGLSTSKAIVEGMGGHIRFETETGRGTIFRVLLPLLTSVERAEERPLVGQGQTV